MQATDYNAGSHRLKSLHRRARLAAATENREKARLQRLTRQLLARLGGFDDHGRGTHQALQAENDTLQAACQHLQEADRRQRDMIDMIVHDLKAPLAAVLASLDLLMTDLDEGMSDEQRDVLQVADRSARQMHQLIAYSLEVRRMEAGRVPIRLQPLDVASLLAETVEQAQLPARQEGVALCLRLPDVPAWVFADADLTSRIVANLLDNAVRFTPAGGQVVVTCQAGERDVTISVADGGPGIPAGQQDAIFEIFYQVGRGPRWRDASVGLGLAFCKLALAAQKGRIWVENGFKSGAQFTFTLPAW